MRLLVTGGAGFIGSNLIRQVLARTTDIEILNLDALTYSGHLENLRSVEDDPRYTFVQGDICDREVVGALMGGMDAVMNLAAESHVDRSIDSADPFVRTNVLGTQVLLSAALAEKVERFVQVSTDEVYGELPWVDPDHKAADRPRFTEETPLAPRSPYSASKAGADHLVNAYYTTHGLPTIITRCSNNYGPFQHPEKLIPVMITRALAEEPLPVYGDGLNIRDWIHVEDHCTGLVAALHDGKPGEIYNFGGNAERTNLDVVKGILRELDASKELITFVTDRLGHDRRYAVDASKAQSELGWSPVWTFEQGLAETVRWYLENEPWWRGILEQEERVRTA